MAQQQTGSADLLIAVAKAQNTDVILKIVDESLERAAEARRAREKRETEEREKEERDRRMEEFERREERAAEELSERNERVAKEVARRESEAEGLRLAFEHSVRTEGRLDFVL